MLTAQDVCIAILHAADRGDVLYLQRDGQALMQVNDEISDALDQHLPDPGKYLLLPSLAEFEVGRALALAFASQHLRASEYLVAAAAINTRSGLSRFEVVMANNGQLSHWQQFQQQALLTALRRWCEIQRIVLR